MFKRILVAIDGTSASRRAFQTAVELAADQHAELDVVHVLEGLGPVGFGPGGMYASAEYVEAMLEMLQKNGERVLAAAAKEAETHGIAARTVMIPAGWSVSEIILQQATKRRADLVVLGTHGRRGLRRVVMGSDAEAVLRECRVPVLVVRSAMRARAAAGAVVAPESAGRSSQQKTRKLQ
jgi:nucleotide-binding universal stress UspA family protein